MDCAVYCHHIASVSTDHAVAVLRDWFVGVANRHLALGPPSSGWRLKKLPGSSQGFCLFLFLLLRYSFSPIACRVLALPLRCSKESRSPVVMV